MIKIEKIVLAATVLMLFLGTVTLNVMAYTLPPLPPGTSSGGSGGGGSSGGSYSVPVFQAYTKPLKSSDGSVIGRLEGRDFNSVMVWAEKNGTAGNATYDVTITGELSQQLPDSCWLDINFEKPDATMLPKGMDNMPVLAAVNITGSPSDGWNYKAGTLKYTLKITDDTLKSLDPGATYYLVRFDGTNYIVQTLSGSGAGANPITFSVNPSGDKGTFMIVEAVEPTPTPTPTPVPTHVSTPAPSPTPAPESIGITSIAIAIVTFILGVVASVGALYLVFMRGKGQG